MSNKHSIISNTKNKQKYWNGLTLIILQRKRMICFRIARLIKIHWRTNKTTATILKVQRKYWRLFLRNEIAQTRRPKSKRKTVQRSHKCSILKQIKNFSQLIKIALQIKYQITVNKRNKASKIMKRIDSQK